MTVTESSARNECLLCGTPVDPDKWPFDPAKTRVVYCDKCVKEMERQREEAQ